MFNICTVVLNSRSVTDRNEVIMKVCEDVR